MMQGLKSMKAESEDFADLLGRYLARAGFTQQELAYKIGMHRNTIVKWMNRTSVPTHRGQVLRLADELVLVKEERKALLQAVSEIFTLSCIKHLKTRFAGASWHAMSAMPSRPHVRQNARYNR
jgi:transcriptional regulator with XRE-family HTH domain